MHIVSTIIRRYLLQRNPIAIEGLGTLHVALSDAQLLPGRRLEPPRRMLELVPTETEDIPLTELVAEDLTTDSITASELCREWREQTFSQAQMEGMDEDIMLLEGVGTISIVPYADANFYPDPYFLTLLNPLPAEPLIVPTPTMPRYRSITATAGTRSSFVERPTLRPRLPKISAKEKNPHNYTVSFMAIIIVLAALSYLCYYMWNHTDLLSRFLLN